MKTLSILIPAYNSESYLDCCLNSLLINDKIPSPLEVIIVNDGSTDNTSKIAHSWQRKFPKNIIVIDKENGGHGSTINAGLSVATGKYFRVLDSDDWIRTENLQQYINILSDEPADLILTEYTRCEVLDNCFKTFKFSELPANKTLPIKNINRLSDDAEPINFISIHSAAIRTAALKQIWQEELLEKTFYEDQEFVAKIILAADNFYILPLDVYQYYIGRSDQSMNQRKLFQNRAQHAKVILKIANLIKETKSSAKRDILTKRLIKIYQTHYWIYYYHVGLTPSDRKEFAQLKNQLLGICPQLAKSINIQYRSRIFIGRIKNTMFSKMQKGIK